ncbi:MAG: hypothetical protein D6744_07860 [Planctomycetota bacterium]|nr:MAG: hypothetical protein D6744_07860 [Planctomycetota bacterium]
MRGARFRSRKTVGFGRYRAGEKRYNTMRRGQVRAVGRLREPRGRQRPSRRGIAILSGAMDEPAMNRQAQDDAVRTCAAFAPWAGYMITA